MKVLITEIKINIKASGFNRVWQSFLSTNDEYCLPREAESDLTKQNISFTLADVTLPQPEEPT